MAYGLKQVNAPSGEPLDLVSTKKWLRLDQDAEDDLVGYLISAARRRFELVTDRQCLTATWQLQLPGFPVGAFPYQGWYPYAPTRYGWGVIRGFNSAPPDLFPNALRMPLPPLQSVASIAYTDTGGNAQTIAAANYDVVTSREPGIIVPSIGNFWPASVALLPDAVTITFLAGYGKDSDVPQDIKQAMRRCVAHEYEQREKADEEYLDRLFLSFCGGGYV